MSGLCVSARWQGDPRRALEPWRDTGVELRGPAVGELVSAFADVWRACGGAALPPAVTASTGAGRVRGCGARAGRRRRAQYDRHLPARPDHRRAGAAVPVADRRVLRRNRGLRAGAAPRLRGTGSTCACWCPGRATSRSSPLSRARSTGRCSTRGSACSSGTGRCCTPRPPLPTAPGRGSARPTSTSRAGIGNYELDVAIEDAAFAARMAAQYEDDLERATEIVLTRRNRVQPTDRSGARAGRAPGVVGQRRARRRGRRQRRQRAGRRAHQSSPARAGGGAAARAGGCGGADRWPSSPCCGRALVAWPFAVLAGWIGLAALVSAWSLRRRRIRRGSEAVTRDPSAAARREDG